MIEITYAPGPIDYSMAYLAICRVSGLDMIWLGRCVILSRVAAVTRYVDWRKFELGILSVAVRAVDILVSPDEREASLLMHLHGIGDHPRRRSMTSVASESEAVLVNIFVTGIAVCFRI